MLVAVEGEINAATIYQTTRAEGCDVVSIGAKKNEAALIALDKLITKRTYSRVLVWLDDEADAQAAGEKLRRHRPKLMKSPTGLDANDLNQLYGASVLKSLILERFPPVSGRPDPFAD